MRFLGLLVFLLMSVQGQEGYFAVGTPPNPKVKVNWDTYRSTAAVQKVLESLQQAHPEWCKLESLGQSYGGRELWLMTISAPSTESAQKSAFWIDGGIHANELQGVEACLYTAWYLLEMKDSNEFINRLLRERTFYIMPIMSPDSRDAHLFEANSTHSPRSGQIPVDDDKDGLVDEDGFDDLNKDGSISLMRKKDPHGQFIESTDRPGLMVRVQEGQLGEYIMLGMEGIDNDNDGKINEDGDGWYDPNRNWAWNWQPEQYQRGAHNFPFSLPEVRKVAQAVMKRRNIAGAQTYHNTGGMLLIGPGGRNDSYKEKDVQIFNKLAAKGEKIIPGYKLKVIHQDLYTVYGGEVDWFYKMRGVFCFNNELFTRYNFFHKKTNSFIASAAEMYEFDKYLLFKQGSIVWQEFDHPQFGQIEIGGFTKNWMRQPPGFMIQEECHRNMAFTLYHADQMPLVKISDVEVRKIKGDLYEITVVLKNNKLCPTHSAHDLEHHINPPNFLLANGENIEVLAALTAKDSLFRDSRQQFKNPARVQVNSIGSYSSEFIRFLVRGSGPVSITFLSERAGRDYKEVEIP